MLLAKNPQSSFKSSWYSKKKNLDIHAIVILNKHHKDRVKIVDYFQRANVWASPISFSYFFQNPDWRVWKKFLPLMTSSWLLTHSLNLCMKDIVTGRPGKCWNIDQDVDLVFKRSRHVSGSQSIYSVSKFWEESYQTKVILENI